MVVAHNSFKSLSRYIFGLMIAQIGILVISSKTSPAEQIAVTLRAAQGRVGVTNTAAKRL